MLLQTRESFEKNLSAISSLWICICFHWASLMAPLVKSPPGQCRRYKGQDFHPWVRRIPWGRKWHPLQYSCLENPMPTGAWRGCKESDVTECVCACACAHTYTHTHTHTHTCFHCLQKPITTHGMEVCDG